MGLLEEVFPVLEALLEVSEVVVDEVPDEDILDAVRSDSFSTVICKDEESSVSSDRIVLLEEDTSNLSGRTEIFSMLLVTAIGTNLINCNCPVE